MPADAKHLPAKDLLARAAEHHQAGRLEEAVAIYRRLAKSHPTSFEVHRLLIFALLQAGRPREAVPAAKRACDALPLLGLPRLLLAASYLDCGKPEKALSAAEAALALDPTLAEAHFIAGNILAAQGRHGAAADRFSQVLDLDSRAAEALANRAAAFARLGRMAEALRDREALAAMQPWQARHHVSKADVLLELGRLKDALTAAEAAISAEPRLADAHLLRGRALLHLGEPEAARVALEAAVELDPRRASLRAPLAQALRRLGLVEAARLTLEEGLTHDPRAPGLLAELEHISVQPSPAPMPGQGGLIPGQEASGYEASGYAGWGHAAPPSGAGDRPPVAEGAPAHPSPPERAPFLATDRAPDAEVSPADQPLSAPAAAQTLGPTAEAVHEAPGDPHRAASATGGPLGSGPSGETPSATGPAPHGASPQASAPSGLASDQGGSSASEVGVTDGILGAVMPAAPGEMGTFSPMTLPADAPSAPSVPPLEAEPEASTPNGSAIAHGPHGAGLPPVEEKAAPPASAETAPVPPSHAGEGGVPGMSAPIVEALEPSAPQLEAAGPPTWSASGDAAAPVSLPVTSPGEWAAPAPSPSSDAFGDAAPVVVLPDGEAATPASGEPIADAPLAAALTPTAPPLDLGGLPATGAATPRAVIVVDGDDLGETLLNVRLLRVAADRGIEVTFLTRADRLALLAPLDARLHLAVGEGSQPIAETPGTLSVPLADLAARLHLSPEAFPQPPYLRPDAARVAHWAAVRREAFTIGFAFAEEGAEGPPPSAFAALADLPGVRLLSLMGGAADDALTRVAFGARVDRLPLLDPATRWADLSAVLQQVNLVVTGAGPLAYLAGARGRPGIVLLNDGAPPPAFGSGERAAAFESLYLVHPDTSETWDARLARAAALALRLKA